MRTKLTTLVSSFLTTNVVNSVGGNDAIAAAAVVVVAVVTETIVDGIPMLSTLPLLLFGDDEKEGERDGIHEFDSPSLSTTLDNAIGTGDGEVSCAKFSSLLSMIDDGDDDNIDDAATVDWDKLASLFVSTPSLLLQPVIPAKQLWVMSEHSNRDPPGHGSHTLLALEAETPH